MNAQFQRATGRELSTDEELSDLMAELYDDPLLYVQNAYLWGEGDLRGFDGPDDWQSGFFRELGEEIRSRDFDGRTPVEPIRDSTVSGHGIGKSALTGMLSDFVRSTRPHSKGVVTANTGAQLETKTWAEIAKWGRRSWTAHWWRITSGRGAMKIVHRKHPETWRLDGFMWQEHNAEAFAGLHAATSTPYYLFDEASKIPNIIFETAQGGLTDGEPMMFLFGNGTRNSGYFYETQNRFRNRWRCRSVDSRTVKITNKPLLQQWIDDYGVDSDYVKIRILGQFPRQSSMQFIAGDIVDAAFKREPNPAITDPIIFGVDVARFGDDTTKIRIRKGRDAKSYPVTTLVKQDLMVIAGKVAELAREHLPDAIFVDETGLGAGVVDRLHQLRIPNVIGVNFGGASPSRECRRMVDYIWHCMRDWIKTGGCLLPSEQLKTELTVREYTFDADNRFVLESKDDLKGRGEASPDDADALALTFAHPVGPRNPQTTARAHAGTGHVGSSVGVDYDPYKD